MTDYWIKRYDLKNQRPIHEGWAIIVVDSKGFFATVSDYGDYAYHWRDFGACFKHFLIGVNKSYLLRKIADSDHYDGVATLERAKEVIIQLRKEDYVTRVEARRAWKNLEEFENLKFEDSFKYWVEDEGQHPMGEFWHEFELPFRTYPPMVKLFVDRVWPRFIKELQKEV